ncbi:MAG: hypothetical protein LC744_03820 [Chloroflexi bacterium]|nr:hypothetical protein [Chloroflexota bacterium]
MPAKKSPKPTADTLKAVRDAVPEARAVRPQALGLPDAEDLARARIGGKADRKPVARMIRARIDRLLEEADADEDAPRLVEEAVQMIAAEGGRIGPDLPGLALVETDADGAATNRHIDLD